ncbi:hypothetical protein [Asanoa sp. NPDC050611]|uniref:hypothetical protein n=1 Tax=Asanoa sp. NPDC050611 TaxID=3157098 RepID=UPI0033D30C21
MSTPRSVTLLALVLTVALFGVVVAMPGAFERSDASSGGEGIQWRKRLPSALLDGAYVGGVVVLRREGGIVEAFTADRAGRRLWAREADWFGVAGYDEDAVVVVDKVDGSGFDVLDPASGSVRWTEPDADVVGTYWDSIVSVQCPRMEDATDRCDLTRRRRPEQPGAAWVESWRTPIPPPIGPPLAPRPFSTGSLNPLGWQSLTKEPQAEPRFLAIETTAAVSLVDVATGRLVRDVGVPEATRVVAAEDRLLYTAVAWRDGRCGYDVWAQEVARPRETWRKSDELDLGTAEPQWGCRDPDTVFGGYGIIRSRWQGRELLLSATDGSTMWLGDPHDELLATDGRVVLAVDSADRRKIKTVDVPRRQIWENRLPGEPRMAALEPNAAVIGGDDWLQIRIPGSVWDFEGSYSPVFVSMSGSLLSEPDDYVTFVRTSTAP